MLELIQQKLGGLVTPTWAQEMQTRGELVKLFRQYYDGEHRLQITSTMRKMLGVSDTRLDRYNVNYCQIVVDNMADRLTVDTITASSGLGGAALELADFLTQQLPQGVNAQALAQQLVQQFGMKPQMEADEPGQMWMDQVLETNRFDGLQIKVRKSALCDGDTFVMCEFNEDTGLPEFSHEPAWDGDWGSMVIYDRKGKAIVAAVKMWYEGDVRRANIYYPDRVEKYEYESVEVVSKTGQKTNQMRLTAYKAEESVDTTREGRAPGVPLIHFSNHGGIAGKSELLNVIPLQDSLNQTLVSMVMSALLSGFPVFFAKGWEPPSGITPGFIFHANYSYKSEQTGAARAPFGEEEARAFRDIIASMDLTRIEAGDLSQLINQAEWLIAQIATISSTPVPSQMGGDSQSGEALKQRDTRMLGKLLRAQVQIGNAWEDAFALGHRQATLFSRSDAPPGIVRFATRWKTAEIRNDDALLKLAELFFKYGFEREALRTISQTSTAQYTEDGIDKVIEEKQQDSGAGAATDVFGQTLPDFSGAMIPGG